MAVLMKDVKAVDLLWSCKALQSCVLY